jgi:predicted flavoprotein YhiN
MEGSGVYPLSEAVRKQLAEKGKAFLEIDFKSQKTKAEIIEVIKHKLYKNTTEALCEGLKLSDVAILLLKTCLSKETFLEPDALAEAIKHFQLEISEMAPIDEAISTVGGIALSEVTDHFELKKMPGVYAIGEMLDWDAPTGGYLLQMCFSMAAEVAGRLEGK